MAAARRVCADRRRLARLEHINPHKGVFIAVMDEIWRVLKPRAQFAFVVPHASSHGYQQDPTHCNMINETTMHYFDPDPEGHNIGQQLYGFYRPKLEDRAPVLQPRGQP